MCLKDKALNLHSWLELWNVCDIYWKCHLMTCGHVCWGYEKVFYYLSLIVILMLIACSTYELIRFCMSVQCLSEWVRWLEKKRLSLLISQPAPGLWGLFSPHVLLLARFLPPCHRQRPVLLTWVEAWPVPFWQSALGSHEDLGTSVFNVEIPPPSVETFFFFFGRPL